MKQQLDTLNLYTDGAYSPVTQTGGWAVCCPEIRLKIANQAKDTTNNRMEMTAAINALKWVLLAKAPITTVNIYSDSLYVINTIKGLYQKKTNNDLWDYLDRLCLKLSEKGIIVNWVHVKGHAGHLENEVVDRLANLLSQTKLIRQ